METHVGEVVGLDRCAEVVVDLPNLREHLLGLRLLGGDRSRVGLGRRRRQQQRCYADKERLRLSSPAANH